MKAPGPAKTIKCFNLLFALSRTASLCLSLLNLSTITCQSSLIRNRRHQNNLSATSIKIIKTIFGDFRVGTPNARHGAETRDMRNPRQDTAVFHKKVRNIRCHVH